MYNKEQRALERERIRNKHTFNEINNTIQRDTIHNNVPNIEFNVSNIELDTMDTLNILSNQKTLSSDYIFVICYRNQEHRIVRCIDSIINQHFTQSFGVILIDDASTDNSFIIASNHLINNGINCVCVKNNNRKFLARNLYNAVNIIANNNESVIIQLDGDDYLNTSLNTLDVLDTIYSNGFKQTFGNFLYSNNTKNTPNSYNLNLPHDIRQCWNHYYCESWSPLKSYKVYIFKQIPLELFFESDSTEWIRMGDDCILPPVMMDICGVNSVKFITSPLYVYDYNESNSHHDTINNDHAAYLTFKLRKRIISHKTNDTLKKYKSYNDYLEKKCINPVSVKYKPAIIPTDNRTVVFSMYEKINPLVSYDIVQSVIDSQRKWAIANGFEYICIEGYINQYYKYLPDDIKNTEKNNSIISIIISDIARLLKISEFLLSYDRCIYLDADLYIGPEFSIDHTIYEVPKFIEEIWLNTLNVNGSATISISNGIIDCNRVHLNWMKYIIDNYVYKPFIKYNSLNLHTRHTIYGPTLLNHLKKNYTFPLIKGVGFLPNIVVTDILNNNGKKYLNVIYTYFNKVPCKLSCINLSFINLINWPQLIQWFDALNNISVYGIKPGYKTNPYQYFDDTNNKDEYQLDVYKYAHDIAVNNSFNCIIDVGCGSAYKLMTLFNKMHTIGIDVKETVEFLNKKYPDRTWVCFDDVNINTSTDLIICADVIEHVIDPDFMLDQLNKISAKRLIISTPNRDCHRGVDSYGPPENKAHVREWNFDEFHAYIKTRFINVKSVYDKNNPTILLDIDLINQ